MAKNAWGDEIATQEDPRTWGDKPVAQRDLPADVTPSAAGGGRGRVNPPTTRDRQIAEMDAATDPTNPDYDVRSVGAGVDAKRTRSPGRVLDADIPPISLSSAARDVASGALQIGPTAVKGVGDIVRLASADTVGKGITEFAERGNQAIQEVVGSQRSQAQRTRFQQDMADPALNAADVVAGNPGALADQVLPTVGSMALPVGAAAGANALATGSRAARVAAAIDPATVAARAATATGAAVLGTTVAQNAGDTFSSVRDQGGDRSQAYLAAAITAPATYLASRLTAGGAEGAVARTVTGQASQRAAMALPKAAAKEGAQEVGEQVGQSVGETVGTGAEFDTNKMAKEAAVAGTLGAVVGGGIDLPAAVKNRVKLLRDAGEQEAANFLERQAIPAEIDKMGAAAAHPSFQAAYRANRAAGLKPAEAAARSGIWTGFDELATSAGLSEKAKAAVRDRVAKMPMDEVPAFLERYTAALNAKGMGAPLPAGSVEQVLGTLRDDALGAAMSIYAETPADTAAAITDLENAQNPAADAQTTPVDAQTPAFDAGNDVIVTPETDRVHTAATSPLNDLPEPTQAQKEAGNYKLGRLRIAGMDISVENPQGSTRRGTDADGKAWQTPMRHHYGYFKGTTANDGDKLDVFVKPGTPDDYRGPVFVVDQIDPKTGKLDEHKVILGAADEAEAEAMYRANYDAGWQGLGAITSLPMPAFKAWARSGTLKEPLGDLTQAEARAAAAPAQPAAPVPAPAADPAAAAPMQPPAGDPAVADGAASEPYPALMQAQPQQQQQANAAGRRARAASWQKNPLMAFLAQHGISLDLAAEFAPGPKERRRAMVAGYGPVFRRAGLSIDKLAELAAQDGFLPPGSRDADALYALIGRAIRGERVAPLYAEGAAEQEIGRRLADRADEPTPEEMDAIADLSELAENELDAIEDLVDDVPDFDAQSNMSTEDAMRAMGFSEQEISDAKNRQATEEPAGPPADGEGRGQPAEAAPEQAPRADRGREGAPGREGVSDARSGIEARGDASDGATSPSGGSSRGEAARALVPRSADVDATEPRDTGAASASTSETAKDIAQTPAPAGVSASGLTWELRPSGTLAVKGDTATIKAKLASLPPKTLMVMQGGIMVGKTQVQKALDILQDKPAPAPAAKPLSMGTTPSGADPVTVKDGVVFIGKYEALDFDSGEPITVPAGATDEQVKKALKDGGAIGKRQKFFGGATAKPDDYTGPTMAEVRAVMNIPTTEKMTRAMALVGEEEFVRTVERKKKQINAKTVDQEALAVEAAAIEILALDTRKDKDTLTAPTEADVLAQQDRKDKAAALDDKAQIDREAERQTLTAQTAPEQRRDNTGDMFGGPTADDVQRARKPGKQQDDDGTAPLFSRGSKDQPRDMIIQHNLTAENLLHAERMGGIPVPSLAITKAAQPMESFGEITLLGDADMATPRGDMKVFGADIYSPRYPSVEYKPDSVSLKKIKAVLEPFRKEGEYALSELRTLDDLTGDKAFVRYADSKVGGSASYAQLKSEATKLAREAGAEERIFQGFTYSGNRKYKAHTLDNVIAILKKELRGGESFNYGAGSLRAKFTPQFRTIQAIRNSKDRLITKEAFEKVKDEINKELLDLSYDMVPNGGFRSSDTGMAILEEGARIGMRRAAKGYDIDLSDDQVERANEFLQKLRNLPTAYFEAKALRAMDLSEFKVAVVPDSLDADARRALEKRGVKIVTYPKGDTAARNKAIADASADNGLMFSRAWRSDLRDKLDDAKMESSKKEGWRAFIQGLTTKGVKPDEIEWSGVTDWLKMQPGKVTKQQVLDYLDANGVQVQEVTLGTDGSEDYGDLFVDKVGTLNGKPEWAVFGENTDAPIGGTFATKAEAQRAMESMRTENAPTKYSQYTLPGGQNYREVLLTLPTKPPEPLTKLPDGYEVISDRSQPTDQRFGITPPGQIHARPWAGRHPTAEAARAAALDRLNYEQASGQSGQYKSSHWDQPNVLAHIRLNDRTDSDGNRVLFVEELQSDWAQDGRRKGFNTKTTPEQVAREVYGRALADLDAAERDGVMQEVEGRNEGTGGAAPATSGVVPRAPFVESTDKWLSLALKRIITMAAQEGYDKVAFVNGEQSADRYDLSKQVDRIDAKSTDSGDGGLRYNIDVSTKDGKDFNRDGLSEQDLVDHVGKEMAQKIVDATGATIGKRARFSGLDLKVGGEGMKAFYNTIVPNTLKTVLKKVGGGPVESVVFGGEDSGGRFVVFDDDSGDRLYRTNNRNEAKEYVRTYAGDASIKEVDGNAGVGLVGEQPGFTITPEMRQKASQGLPLFGKGQKATGLTPTQFTQALSEAFGAKVADRLQSKGVVVPLADQTKLPAHVVPYLREGDRIFGFYDPRTNRTYAVLENLQPGMVKGLALHEVGVHYGFEPMLGADKYAQVMKQLDSMHKLGSKAVRAARAEAIKNAARPSQVPEETLAYLVQNSPELSLIKEVIAKIKAFLFREFGIGGKYLTEADLHMLAKAAVQHAARLEPGGVEVPAFMRASDDPVAASAVAAEQVAAFRSQYPATPPSGMSMDAARTWLRDRRTALDALVQELVPMADGMALPVRNGGTWLVSREARPDGSEWRITRFDRNMVPQGHEAHRSAVDAVADLVTSVDVSRLDGWQPAFSRAPSTDTKAFKDWFKDSKVVDADGKPQVVYHGTSRDFSEFMPGVRDGGGIFFSSDPQAASWYAGQRGQIMPVYLRVKRLMVVDYKGEAGSRIDAIDSAKSDGFDGVLLRNHPDVSGTQDQYVVFSPDQIKSVFNRGTFDPKDPDIRFSRTQNLFEPDAWSAPEPTRTDRAIYEIQNGRIDLKRVQQAITAARGAIDQKFDAQLAETLYPGRVARRTDLFLDREVKPLLTAMATSKATMDELADYLIARHAPERNAQVAKVNPDLPDGGAGRNSKDELMTNEAAAAYMAGIPAARRAELAALAEKVDAITAGTRGLLVAEGLEKAETVAAWNGAYKNYVPLFKDEAEHPHPQGTGFNVKGPASKRSTGSTKQVTDVIAHVLMQREAAIARAEKNRVGMALYGLALSNPNRVFWTTIKPGMTNEAIGRELQGMGVDPTVAEAGMDKVPTIRTVDPLTQKVVDRPNPIYKSMPGAITLKVNGEDRVLLINTTNERGLRMAEALKNLDGMTKFDLAGSIVGKTTRWMAAINTQYNPAFGLVNLVRDTLGGAVNIGSTKLRGKGLKVLADVPMAMQGIARELSGGGETSEWSRLWKQFQDDGGKTGYREVFAQAKDRADAIERELKAAQSAGKLTPGKVGHAVLDLLDGFNTTLENAVRLAAYKNALDIGMTRPQAARLGRELTVDFNRKGRLGRELGPLYAFFNASVQGGARTLEALRGPTGGKIIAGGLALGALQALMLLAAGYDDDEIPEYVKTRTLIIPLLGTEKKFVAIPYPLGLHVIPNLGRVTTELALNGGKDAGKRAFNAVGEIAAAFNPLGGGNIFTADGALKTLAPTVVDPLIEMGYNRNFAGNRIEREARGETDTRPGFQRAKEATLRSTTGQAYLGISKAINTMTGGTAYEKGLASPSPEMVRYIAQTAGGGVLREFEKTVDSSVKAMTGEKVKMTGIPVLGRFYGEVDDDQVQASRYYDKGRTIDKLQASLKAAQAAGDGAAMQKIIEDNPELAMARAHDQVQREIAKLNKAAVSTVGDRDTIQAIDKARVDAMRGLNDAIKAMEEAEGKVTPGQRLRAAVAGK